MFVCLSVCCVSQKPHVEISRNVMYMLLVAVTSCDGGAVRSVRPVVWMTSCFYMMQGIGQNQ